MNDQQWQYQASMRLVLVGSQDKIQQADPAYSVMS